MKAIVTRMVPPFAAAPAVDKAQRERELDQSRDPQLLPLSFCNSAVFALSHREAKEIQLWMYGQPCLWVYSAPHGGEVGNFPLCCLLPSASTLLLFLCICPSPDVTTSLGNLQLGKHSTPQYVFGNEL